ncbi:MAG: glycerate kinase [Clostridium sp.]|nr:glycerate kinase [Clostridium sp.]
MDALTEMLGGIRVETVVSDPLGRPVTAIYGIIDGGRTAVIEMSAASGLPLLSVEERNPLLTSTYGAGEMILDALRRGCRKFLVGTGTVAGIIKASDIKDAMIGMLSAWSLSGAVMAPLSSILMSAATASSTAGATIASASFAPAVLEAGVSAVSAAAMTNAGATVLDHLPHGSFFHTTGGTAGMQIKERLRLVPFESITGLTLALVSLLCSLS